MTEEKGGVWVVRLVVLVVLLMLVGSNECLLLRFEVCGDVRGS